MERPLPLANMLICPRTSTRVLRTAAQKALGLFVGGLAEEVDDKVLHAAFIPFGDITDIQIPLDYETGEFFWFLLCSESYWEKNF